MSEMIERAARALFKDAHAEHVEEYQWEEACKDLQDDYRDSARAALLPSSAPASEDMS